MKIVGCIVCKATNHGPKYRGYIAMLTILKHYRRQGIASSLVAKALNAMKDLGVDEVAVF